jgi:hypothetical protein
MKSPLRGGACRLVVGRWWLFLAPVTQIIVMDVAPAANLRLHIPTEFEGVAIKSFARSRNVQHR